MRSAAVLAAIVVLGLGALALVRQGTGHQTLLAGGVLVVVGLPLLGLARWQLGRAFAVTPQAKGLVTQGLYARIPHPMYVFLDLALLGAIIMARREWLLFVWAGLVAVQVRQARREARVLEQAYGDAYRAYRKRTWW
ncbi:MAG: Phospholipid methyltransferase [candidate division NC10 bacterium]|jgi:protein-S-isoprenylcysteine O-methyltransferase Ste14|nr:Phospholipid methyltransferase [candidate division NC10 bacterium]